MNSRLRGWQILFLIEGAFTVAFAILAAFLLPHSPLKCNFLSEREKEVAALRLLKDGSVSINTKLDLRRFFKPLRDWKFYIFGTIALCYGIAGSVASNFLTQIVGRWGARSNIEFSS